MSAAAHKPRSLETKTISLFLDISEVESRIDTDDGIRLRLLIQARQNDRYALLPLPPYIIRTLTVSQGVREPKTQTQEDARTGKEFEVRALFERDDVLTFRPPDVLSVDDGGACGDDGALNCHGELKRLM